jgi:hypothetical protein
MRNTKFRYIRGQERPFDAQRALCSAPEQRPRQGESSSLSLIVALKRESSPQSASCQWAACGLADPPNQSVEIKTVPESIPPVFLRLWASASSEAYLRTHGHGGSWRSQRIRYNNFFLCMGFPSAKKCRRDNTSKAVAR